MRVDEAGRPITDTRRALESADRFASVVALVVSTVAGFAFLAMALASYELSSDFSWVYPTFVGAASLGYAARLIVRLRSRINAEDDVR